MNVSQKFQLELVKGKLNVEHLRNEVASAMGLPPESVGVQVCHGGEVRRRERGAETVETLPATVEVIAPEGSLFWKAEGAIAQHAPQKSDTEKQIDDDEERLRDHPVIKRILQRLKALEDKAK